MGVVEALLFGICGALWRRWFGGWGLSCSRGLKLLVAGVLGIFATLPLGWWSLPVSTLAVVYWVPGHMLQEWGLVAWLKRYGPFGVYWWLAGRYPFRYRVGNFINGSFSLAELAGGFSVYFALALVVGWLA